jgi:hypothetical protein
MTVCAVLRAGVPVGFALIFLLCHECGFQLAVKRKGPCNFMLAPRFAVERQFMECGSQAAAF